MNVPNTSLSRALLRFTATLQTNMRSKPAGTNANLR